jgi:hypothetical protein
VGVEDPAAPVVRLPRKIGTAIVSARELDEALEAASHESEPNKGASAGLDD